MEFTGPLILNRKIFADILRTGSQQDAGASRIGR